ncbi:MAG: helix-turn-helix transcriptional regulator [Verrucomicrobia bacterium]|nr:helix-turn-helix transcriptional regulator [Verrucomicrobiota bacterium]
MRFSDDRTTVLAVLTQWLAAPSSLPVVRVLEGKKPENEHPAFFMEVPRLIVVLDGRGTFLTIEDGREVVFDVAPGQVLFLAPFTWICPVPRVAYRSFSVIFRPDSTRLTVHARRAAAADGTVPSRYLAQWRTQETLGAKGERLLQLLRDPPAARLGARTFNLLMEVLLAEVTTLAERAPEHSRSTQTVLWQSVCDYLSEHWSDPQLSRQGTAEFFNRHPNHFSRFFHAHAKQNFRKYVNEIRLERSLHFLRDLRYNVTDVALLCGFTDLQYFIRCFRQRFGFTPGEYRKRHEN